MDEQRPPPTQVFFDNNVSMMEVDDDVLMPEPQPISYETKTNNFHASQPTKTRQSILNFDPLMDMEMDVDQSMSDSFLDQLTVKKPTVEPQTQTTENSNYRESCLLDITALDPITSKDKAIMELSIHATFNAPGNATLDDLSVEDVLNQIDECHDSLLRGKHDEVDEIQIKVNDNLNFTFEEREKSADNTLTIDKSSETERSFENTENNESLRTVIDRTENISFRLELTEEKPINSDSDPNATFETKIDTSLNQNEPNITLDNSTNVTLDNTDSEENYLTAEAKRVKNLNTTYGNLPISAQINIEHQLEALRPKEPLISSDIEIQKSEAPKQNFDDQPLPTKTGYDLGNLDSTFDSAKISHSEPSLQIQNFDDMPINVKPTNFNPEKLDGSFDGKGESPQNFDEMSINSKSTSSNLEAIFENRGESPVQAFDEIPISLKPKGSNLDGTFENQKEESPKNFDDIPISSKPKSYNLLDATLENRGETPVQAFDEIPINGKLPNSNLDATFENIKGESPQNFDDIPICSKPKSASLMDATFENQRGESPQNFDEIPINSKIKGSNLLDATFENKGEIPVQAFDEIPISVKPISSNLNATFENQKGESPQSFNEIPINAKPKSSNFDATFENRGESQSPAHTFDEIPINSKPNGNATFENKKVENFDDIPIVPKKTQQMDSNSTFDPKNVCFDNMPINSNLKSNNTKNLDASFENKKMETSEDLEETSDTLVNEISNIPEQLENLDKNVDQTFNNTKTATVVQNFDDIPISVKKNQEFQNFENTSETGVQNFVEVKNVGSESVVQNFDDIPISKAKKNNLGKMDSTFDNRVSEPKVQNFDEIPIKATKKTETTFEENAKSKPVDFDDVPISLNKKGFEKMDITFENKEKLIKNVESIVKPEKVVKLEPEPEIQIFAHKKPNQNETLVVRKEVVTPIKMVNMTTCIPSPTAEEMFSKNILSSTRVNDSCIANSPCQPDPMTNLENSENSSKSSGNVLNTSFIENSSLKESKSSNILQENNTSSLKRSENENSKMTRSLSKSSDLENSFTKNSSNKVKCCICQGKVSVEKENIKPTSDVNVNEEALKNQNNDLKNQVNNYRNEVEKLNKEILALKNENEIMAEEFQKSRQSTENAMQILLTNMEKVTRERDILQRHLDNAENAFSDVHQKYENLKQQVVELKKSDKLLRMDIMANEETIQRQLKIHESHKEYTKNQFEKGNIETMRMKKNYESDNNKLHAQIKRLEIKCNSLMQNLQQKNKENEELTAAYEEMIKNVT